MDFTLDGILKEVEGALDEAPPGKPSGGDAHPGEVVATESRTSPSLHRDPLASRHQSPLGWKGTDIIMATEQSPQGKQEPMTVAPPSTIPTVASALDVDFDSDSSRDQTPVPRAPSVGVNFDDPDLPEILPETAAVSGAIITATLHTGSPPSLEVIPVPKVGADFDSDSCPIGSTSPVLFGASSPHFHSNTPAEAASATATGVGFAAVPPAAVASTAGVGFDEDDEASTTAKNVSNGGGEDGDKPFRLSSPGKGSIGSVIKDQRRDGPEAHHDCNGRSRASESQQQDQQRHSNMEQHATVAPGRIFGESVVDAAAHTQEMGENRGGRGLVATTLPATKRRRCGTVCVGGTATEKGYCASSLSQRACDKLRCTGCNFEVLRFDGQAWEGTTDYMFFRNNAPDPAKLSARLQPSAGGCAYACQCSWQNVEELRVLSPTEHPRWACGGH